MKPIKASDVGRELIYPLTKRAIVYAMIFYWFLFGLAYIAKLFGIALLFLTLPAYFRYLLYLLEARANGKQAPVPAIEMFNPADNLWTLTPLFHVAVGTWVGIQLASANLLVVGTIAGIAILVIMPASMAVLAVTHAPLQSLNPLTIANMIRACGVAYFIVPATLLAISVSFVALYLAGMPLFFVNLGLSYEMILLFSMTGAVLHAKNVAMQVEIEDPVERSAEELKQDLLQERQKVANHAYGFISRGNREGGFAHIREWLEKETELEEAWRWFFEEMLKWENKNPALFFAQEYLGQLLEWGHEKEAIKLVTRCLHANERWRPFEESRRDIKGLLIRYGRDDLQKQLLL